MSKVIFILLLIFLTVFLFSLAPNSEQRNYSKSREEILEEQVAELEDQVERMDGCLSATYTSIEDSISYLNDFVDGYGYYNVEEALGELEESCVLRGY